MIFKAKMMKYKIANNLIHLIKCILVILCMFGATFSGLNARKKS